MKIKNITHPQKFFRTVRKCAGTVELKTPQGDRLNLKSTLCQYLALTQMFQDESINSDIQILLSDPEDFGLIREYLILE